MASLTLWCTNAHWKCWTLKQRRSWAWVTLLNMILKVTAALTSDQQLKRQHVEQACNAVLLLCSENLASWPSALAWVLDL